MLITDFVECSEETLLRERAAAREGGYIPEHHTRVRPAEVHSSISEALHIVYINDIEALSAETTSAVGLEAGEVTALTIWTVSWFSKLMAPALRF